MFGSWLSEYNVKNHVVCGIGIENKFVSATVNSIAEQTDTNLMKLNAQKSNYMVFSRSETEIALNGETMERIEEIKLVAVTTEHTGAGEDYGGLTQILQTLLTVTRDPTARFDDKSLLT